MRGCALQAYPFNDWWHRAWWTDHSPHYREMHLQLQKAKVDAEAHGLKLVASATRGRDAAACVSEPGILPEVA